MSFIDYCPACNRQTAHHGCRCLECAARELIDRKKALLEARSKMTVEERLTLIESDIFDLQHSIQDINGVISIHRPIG